MIPDLVGCVAKGNSAKHALANTEAAITQWMNLNVRSESDIPTPSDTDYVMERYEQFLNALAIPDDEVNHEIKYIDFDISPWQKRRR